MCFNARNAKLARYDRCTSRNFAWEDAHMTEELPQQRPEGVLLQHALEHDGRSIRAVAPLAGTSDTRWRQIIKGSMTVGGHATPVIAPARTLARMALVIGISPVQLRDAGRGDAADILERLISEGVTEPATIAAPAEDAARMRTDEIDLIYASKSMTAREKLAAIRTVLQLRAQVEAEEAAADDAPATRKTSA
jgi:hypothetical protein